MPVPTSPAGQQGQQAQESAQWLQEVAAGILITQTEVLAASPPGPHRAHGTVQVAEAYDLRAWCTYLGQPLPTSWDQPARKYFQPVWDDDTWTHPTITLTCAIDNPGPVEE